MKRIQILCLFLVLCLCGCAAKQESADSFDTLTASEFTAPSEEKESTQEDDADITADEVPEDFAPPNSQVPPTQEDDADITAEELPDGVPPAGQALSTYDLDDYGTLRTYSYTMGSIVNVAPKTVEEIMERIGPNGLIVSGYAIGERIGVEKNETSFYTKTQFKVDHVFYGEAVSGESITIMEDYILKANEKEVFIYRIGRTNSFLRNEEYVLLLLTPTGSSYPGMYTPARFAMPVAEDCDEWSEDYLDSLLDFFRGDPATYAYGEDGARSFTVKNADGTEREVIYYQPGKRWPQREISNEALIEEMRDNLLVYLATEFKIKIWPTEHVNYVPAHNSGTQAQLNPWQFPKDS